MATKLANSALSSLPQGVSAPDYDRERLTPGILHVGVGNFHRAHQAVYLDEAIAKSGATDWGILGAGVMPADAQMRSDLEGQDFLYSVTEEDADTIQTRVVCALTGFLPVEKGHAPIRRALSDAAIRIVSLTLTEGGYYIDSSTGRFDPDHPSIRVDVAQPDNPETVFGALVAALRDRRAAGIAPFTVMCCDNLPHNGAVTRNAVVGIARGQDEALADWIAENVAFPNGMVDRITPATTPARRDALAARTGLLDARPVFCEPFRQWVLEDKFPQGRPPLEEVGVQFVPDVSPFETMKIRILNGGHALIAYPAGLIGIQSVDEAMRHSLVVGFLDKVEREEVIPAVPPVPDTSLDDYYELIRARFSNPKVGDAVRRICFDGSNKQAKFILNTTAENLAAGRGVSGTALQNALWCRYCFGEIEGGDAVEPNDPAWERLTERARAARADPQAWLGMADIYGATGTDTRFAKAFADWLSALWSDGVETTLKRYLESRG